MGGTAGETTPASDGAAQSTGATEASSGTGTTTAMVSPADMAAAAPSDAAAPATPLVAPTEMAPPAQDAAPRPGSASQAPRLLLREFCAEHSGTGEGPEMIAAFHHTESAAGRMTDTRAAFLERFNALASSPA